MKKNDSTSFFEPQRQSRGAIVLFIYNFFVRILRGFWPVLLVLFFRSGQKQSNTELLLNGVVIIGGGVSLILSIVSYFRYFYHVEKDQLVIQKGVFNQSRVKLPFERIQNINIEQNILHRLLNVVSLRIDSAGSTGSEVSIEALDRDRAEAIRQYVLAQKREAQGSSSAEEEEYKEADLPQSLVLKLDMGDLIRVGITQNHLRTAGIIVGAIFGFVFTLADALGEDFWDQLVEEGQSLNPGVSLFASLAVLLILVAFVITLLRTITRHYNLRFYEDRDGFTLKAGLFNQRETALRKEKIQVVRWKDNPLRRALGIFVLQIRQATSGGGRSDQVTIPGCQIRQVNDVVFSSFRGIDQVKYNEHRIDAAYLWWYFRYLGILPLVLFAGVGIGMEEPRFIFPAVIIPVLAFLYLRAYYRHYRLQVDTEYLRTDSGVIGRTFHLMPIYKVQSVVVQQSFYQRRKDLADVILYTAGGSERIPFLPVAKAHALRDYVLYRIETSTEPWM